MELVVDANILFAALIKRNVTSHLLFRDNFHLYAPEYIFTEFRKYKKLILSKTERSDEEFEMFINILQRRINIVPKEEFKSFVKQAKIISPDPKDVPYISLALRLNSAIWSNDRALKEKQEDVRVYTTSELIDYFK